MAVAMMQAPEGFCVADGGTPDTDGKIESLVAVVYKGIALAKTLTCGIESLSSVPLPACGRMAMEIRG